MAKIAKMSHRRVVVEFDMEEWRLMQRIMGRARKDPAAAPGERQLVLELLPVESSARPQVAQCHVCFEDCRLIDGKLMPHPKVGPRCRGSGQEP